MPDTEPFAVLLLVTAAVLLAVVLSNHITSWLSIPAPALFLVVTAVAVKVMPALHARRRLARLAVRRCQPCRSRM